MTSSSPLDSARVLAELAAIRARLDAEREFEEEREALLKATIREAVAEGLSPVVQRVEKLERLADRLSTYAGIGVAAVAAAAWLAERLLPVMLCAVLLTGCVGVAPIPRQGEILTLSVFAGETPAPVPAPVEIAEPLAGSFLEAPR